MMFKVDTLYESEIDISVYIIFFENLCNMFARNACNCGHKCPTTNTYA